MRLPQTFGVKLMKTRNPNQSAPMAGPTTRISVNGMCCTSAMYAAAPAHAKASTKNKNSFPLLPPNGPAIGSNRARDGRRV